MLAKLSYHPPGYKLVYQLKPDGKACMVTGFDWQTEDIHVRVFAVKTNKTLTEFDSEAETDQEFACDMAKALDKVRRQHAKAQGRA